MKTIPLILTALILGLPITGSAATVMITQASPIEKLDPDGHPVTVTMARIGSTYSLVQQDGDQLILKDDAGNQYRIPLGATNYSPPAASPPRIPPTSNPAPPPIMPTPTQTPPSSNPAPSLSAPPAVSPEDSAKINQLNDAFGFPLLADTLFWQNDAEQVAKRLQWPNESKTTTEESYRRYAIKTQITVLGSAAYSLALYGKYGKPTYISIIFANAGDFDEALKLGPTPDPNATELVMKHLALAVKKDAETISATLTSILGDPSTTLYGNSASNRDEVHRWDWNGLAILLNSHDGEYASIKIIPTDIADHYGTVDVTDRENLRDLLAKRVIRRDNGDVILTEVPMVDQGPKGYCVPATWERYLRYMDLPADLYILAIMGHTGLGGGTNVDEMEAGVEDYVSAYHRRIENYDAPLDVSHIARYIDQGLPLMWSCWFVLPVEIQASKNTRDRKIVTDWDQYAKSLSAQAAALGSFQAENNDYSNGHTRLIIGYNATTNEIAISDSWGAAGAERWLYVPTAQKISKGRIDYLSW